MPDRHKPRHIAPTPAETLALAHPQLSAVSRRIEARTGWRIKQFVRTARRYRTSEIQAGDHTITAADPS